MENNDVAKLRMLKFIPRWSTVPVVHRQSVAEHSFNVTWISKWLCDTLPKVVTDMAEFPKEEKGMICMMAFYHDKEEAIYGDTPSKRVVKYEFDSLREAVVKLADIFDLFLTFDDEERAGNKLFGPALHKVFVDRAIAVMSGLLNEVLPNSTEKDTKDFTYKLLALFQDASSLSHALQITRVSTPI